MKNFFTIILFAAVFLAIGSCKKTIWDTPTYQKISLSQGDSLTEFRLTDVKIEAESQHTYWWYKSNAIKITKGGYSGSLLDSEFIVYEENGDLRTKGLFKNGVKNGSWSFWSDGQLAKQIDFKEGLYDGTYSEFLGGELNLEGIYKGGKKEGKFFKYYSDTTLVEIYKEGVLVEESTDE